MIVNWDIINIANKTTERDVFYVKDMIEDTSRINVSGTSTYTDGSHKSSMFYAELTIRLIILTGVFCMYMTINQL